MLALTAVPLLITGGLRAGGRIENCGSLALEKTLLAARQQVDPWHRLQQQGLSPEGLATSMQPFGA
jgi:hypothetical protein